MTKRLKLVARVVAQADGTMMAMPLTLFVANPTDVVGDEGIDPHSPTLGRRVHWRIVERGTQKLYTSTFVVSRSDFMHMSNVADMKQHLKPEHRKVEITIETLLNPDKPAQGGATIRLDEDQVKLARTTALLRSATRA